MHLSDDNYLSPTAYLGPGSGPDGTVTLRENLVPNPSFEYGTAGWIANSTVTLTRRELSDVGSEGVWAGEVVPNGTVTNNSFFLRSENAPVTPGEQISVRARCRRLGGAVPAELRVLVTYWGEGDVFAGSTVVGNVSTLAGSPSTLNEVTGEGLVVPEGADYASLSWYALAGQDTSGWASSLAIDAHQMVRGATLPPYADGDSVSLDTDLTWEWAGTPGESASQLTAPKPVGWTGGPGILYYSARHDSYALASGSDTSMRAYTTAPTGITDAGEAFTWLMEATTEEEGADAYLTIGGAASGGGASTGPVPLPVGEWTTQHLGIVSAGGGFVWRVQTTTAKTVYFRVAVIDGTDAYAGEWFDGNSQNHGGWNEITNPAVQAASAHYAQVLLGE